MTDREKLIEVLMHLDRHIQNRDEYGICCTSDIAEAIETVVGMLKNQDANGVTLDNQVSSSKWIPVTERLPEKFGEYIVAVKTVDGVVYSDYADYDLFQQRWRTGLYFEIGSNVTHWMPLPEAPKED